MWIGSIHQGLFKLILDDKGNIISTKAISLPPSSNTKLRVTSIIKNDKNIICTTEDGLYEVNEHDSIYPIIPEMKGRICTHAQFDESDNLWISTYTGLYRYSFSSKELSAFFRDLTFYRFLCNREKKEIYACSNNGLYQYTLKAVFQQKSKPEIRLTALRVFDNPVSPGDKISGKTILEKNPNYIQKLVLPYFCNSFSFDVHILDLASTPDNTILYKMNGMDRQWHKRNTSETNISYTNMTAGEYEFQIKAAGSNSAIESEVKVLKIIKLKPWWYSNLAFAIYFLLILLIIYYFSELPCTESTGRL